MKDYFGYQGKVCVVTGAASGMARATCEFLVELGADVYALDVNECAVPGIKKSIKCDLGSKESIDKAFDQIPQVIHKFFGIAGVSGLRQDFATTVTVNFIANKYITEKYVVPRIVDGPVGAIAYISSQGGAAWKGHEAEFIDMVKATTWEEAVAILKTKKSVSSKVREHQGYEFSKRSLIYYTKWMAHNLGPRNIRVNTVGPSNTTSGMIGDFYAIAGTPERAKVMWGPIQREATSREQANAMVFLNSDLAEMIDGTALYVDGACRSDVEIGLAPDYVAGPMIEK